MISVDNFYWVLYHNLLRPIGIDCWYYYPWGTRENFSAFEYQIPLPKQEHHVLFHFDQEPIWSNDLGAGYDTGRVSHVAWSNLRLKILANSEHSTLKRTICRERQMQDWYYFYHGFAALDWFRDAKYIDQDLAPRYVFSSLNHLVQNNRSYRMALTAKLIEQDLHHHGSISFHGTQQTCQAEIDDPDSQLTAQEKHLVEKHLVSGSIPMTLDVTTVDGNLSAHFGHKELSLWQESFWHVVNETVFYEDKLHLTEKIFKPIVSSRPFLLVAAPGNLRYLRSYGFKTFGDWIDESYDDELDPHKRLTLITEQLQRLCDRSPDNLKAMYQDMRPVLDHNRQHFFGEFRERIVNELVDNFDACIRTWNNGRVDGRDLPLHPGLARVKSVLLR